MGSSQHYITDFTNLPVTQSQLTPDASYHQQGLVNTNYQSSGGFSETSSYIPSADNAVGVIVNSPDLSHAASQHQTVHNNNHQSVHSNNHPNVHSNNHQHVHHTQHSLHNVHELFPMEVNPAIQPRGLPEDEVIFSPLHSAKKPTLFSETGAVAATPDISFPDTNNGPREKRRDSSRSVAGFSETIPLVPGADVQIQVHRVTGDSQDIRHGRVISSSQLFRPVAAKTSSFSQTLPVVPGAHVQIVNVNGRQDSRQGKVLQPDTSMFSSSSEFFTETEPVVALPDAERNRESRFQASEKIQESRGGRVLGPDMSLFQPQSSSFSETAAVVPEPDEARNERLSSVLTRESDGGGAGSELTGHLRQGHH